MHRIGWIFIALGALLLFGRLGFFFLPLFFLPLFFLPLAFMGRRMRGPWGAPRGMRPYYWRGRHGYYPRGSCGGPAAHRPAERPAERRGPYTGETTRL